MSLSSFNSPKNRIKDGVDIKGDTPHKISRNQLAPRLIKKARASVNVDPKYFYFFQRKTSGRRCSCWTIETKAFGDCPLCHGTGTIGGFNKWGTKTHIIDWTHPRINTVGIVPNYMLYEDTRPVMFALNKGVIEGYIQTEVSIIKNTQIVDLYQVYASNLSKHNSLNIYIRTAKVDGTVWVELNEENLSLRLSEKKLEIRVVLKREFTEAPSPLFTGLFFRYKLRENLKLKIDIPKTNENITLSEYGIVDDFNTLNFFTDDTVKKITVQDFFYRIDNGTRWKVIEATPFEPMGLLTNYDLTCRLIQDYESYNDII